MRRAPTGFTLLEVLVALLVITAGLLGFAGTLGPVAALAGQGRIQGRASRLVASRVSRLRAEVLAGAPACLPPAAGQQEHSDGISESWSATLDGPVMGVRITIAMPRSRGSFTDTVVTRFSCP